MQPKPSSNRTLIVLAILGGAAVLGIAVIFAALLIYMGLRRPDDANRQIAANTANQTATGNTKTRPTPGAKTPAANSTPEYDDTDLEANPFTIPPAVGQYEQTSTVVGSAAQDFLGAAEVTKAVFSKKGKDVDFVLAKFNSRADAQSNYTDFLNSFKKGGAKVLGTQKIKNKAGVNNGELSVFTFDKKWNALAASDKMGIRIIAPDRYTLLEFVREFDKIYGKK